MSARPCAVVGVQVLVQVGYYHDCERCEVKIENCEKFLQTVRYYHVKEVFALHAFFFCLWLAET